METTVKIKKTINGWMVDGKEYGSLNEAVEAIARKYRFGSWQKEIVASLLQGEKVLASSDHHIGHLSRKMRDKYGGCYYYRFMRVIETLNPKYYPGKQGGRWTGYYVLDLEEENA